MTTQDFLQTLFAGCAGFLELRLLPNDGEPSQQFRPLGDGLDWLCKWGPGGRVDVYFGVYPRTRSAGTADAVAPEVSWLFCDLDGSERPMPQALAPTIIVESGTAGHFHSYWHLTQPIDVATAESANRALARALGGDLNATDRARVLRLPGTVNSKTGRQAIVTHYDPGATYELEDFASLTPVEASANPSGGMGDASGAGGSRLSESASANAPQALHQGKRNASLASLAGVMRRAGMQREEILAALREVNRQRCQPRLPDREVGGIAQSVSRYAPAAVPLLRPVSSSSSSLRVSDSDDDINRAPVELCTLTKPGPRQWVVPGLVPANTLTVLYGDGGMAKSLKAMLIGDCVARGQDLFGRPVQQGRVLYLDWELDQDEQTRRAYRVAAGLGYPQPPPGLFYQQMALPLSDALPQIRHWIEELRILLVILDSFGLATLGDPTAARDVAPLLASVSRLPCTSFFIDHVRNLQPGEKPEDLRPFGSVYKFNIARSVIRAVRVGGDDVSLSILLRQTKSNFSALSEPLGLRVWFEEDCIRFEQESLSSPGFAQALHELSALEKVQQALVAAGEASARELASATGLALGTAKNQLTELHHLGKAVPAGRGLWRSVAESSLSLTLSDDDDDDASQEAPARSSSPSFPLSDDDDDDVWEDE